MSEEWRLCPGWEDLYEVSSLGQVRHLRTAKVLTQRPNGTGYASVNMRRPINLGGNGSSRSFTVHRLVARAFIANPEDKPQVNHIDTDRMNAAASNLEWVDRFENHHHSASLGKYNAATNPRRVKKLTPEILEDCRKRRAAGESFVKIAKHHGVAHTSIYRALFTHTPQGQRRSWDWRSALTDDEKEIVARYDAAVEAAAAAKLAADALRLEFKQIQDRAFQRAKYRKLRAEQEAAKQMNDKG